MRLRRRSWLSAVVLTTTAFGLLLIGNHLAAQPPIQAPPTKVPPLGPGLPPVEADVLELTPRLLAGPHGETLRLWDRLGPLEPGTVVLAVESGQTWRTLLEIAPKEENTRAGTAHLAVGPDGQMAVAYQWWRQVPTSSKQVRVVRSTDGGKTWVESPRLDVSDRAFTPRAAWGREQTLVVVWADEIRGNRVWDVYARRSPDGGATWEPDRLLSRFDINTPTDAHVRPHLVSDGDKRFWAVWVGIRSSRSRLFLNRSTDGGQTWTDPVELTGPSVSVHNHHVLRSGERLLVIWNDRRTGRERIFAVTSSDGGAAWTAPARIDHVPDDAPTDATAPAAVMSPSGEVLVAWHDGRHGRDDIFVGRSADWGRTWDDKETRLDMDEPGVGVSRFASIAKADDGRIAVAWQDDRAGFEGIYVRVRSAGLRPAWGPEMLVAPPAGRTEARTPALLWAKNGSLKIVWELWNHADSILMAKRKIDGRTLLLDKK